MFDFEQLIQDLHSSSNERSRKAAEALRQHGEPGRHLSAESLIHALLHDITPIRKAVGEILREWREYVPIEPLLLMMQDANEQVRSTAKRVLADVGEYAPQESLLPHLSDPDPMVRSAVLSALGMRAPITSVMEALSAPEEDLRETAIFLAGLLKEPLLIEPLIGMLQTSNVRLRAATARALGDLGECIPTEPLIEALHDAEANVRREAVRALGNLKERIPLEPLIEVLHDAGSDVRREAVRALANSGERMPGAALHELLDDDDQLIRQAAMKALVRVGDPAALEIIVNNLHADHEWARETALQRLMESTDVEIHEIASHLPIEELLRLLKDEWWPVGYMAASMIAILGTDAPFAEVLALLSHPLPQARWAALYALALLGEHIPLSQSIPIEPVLTALEAEDVETRRGAAEVLDYFMPRIPVERLLPLIEEEDMRVAHILAKQGRQEGIDALVASLRTNHAWFAAEALGELGEHAPAEPLLAALHMSERTVRQAAAEALYHTHPELLPRLVAELMEVLNSGQVGPLLEPLRHVLLARALAMLRSSQPAILAWFDQSLDAPEWEVRMWATVGLSGMTPFLRETTLEKLHSLLHDPESARVRIAAHRALEELMPQTTD